MLKVLCHASGWCLPSSKAFSEFKTEFKATNIKMHSYRFDGDDFEEEKNDEISAILVPILVSYNESIFDQIYSKFNVTKYNVPLYFKIPLKQFRDSHNEIMKGHFNFSKQFVQKLQKILKSNRNGSLITIVITLSYSPTCNELSDYMPSWNRIKEIVNTYNFGSIIMKEEDATQKGVNLPFTTFKIIYET